MELQLISKHGKHIIGAFTTTFRSKIRRKNPTARGFLFLNLPKITRIHFFFVNVATSAG